MALTQDERANLGTIQTAYLVDWTLGSNTLHLADRDFRYTYGSTTVNYESYLRGIDGLGEIVTMGGSPSNADVTIDLFNEPWSTYAHLSLYNADESFNRSQIAIYELRYNDGETFASDVRTCHFKGVVEELFDVTEATFRIRCSSRLFDKRNAWSLDKVNRSTYPYCSPSDDGKWRNIGYGAIENVPCRCVKTGAIDLLAAYISATQTTLVVQGLTRIPFESGGTIQVGTEVIQYTTFTAATNTFSGCIRTGGVSHDADESVVQLVSAFVYESLKHPARSISAVSVDDYDATAQSDLASGTDIDVFTGQSGDEYSGYSARSVVVFPNDITKPYSKIINKTKDVHTHEISGGTRYYPTTFENGDSAANLSDWASSTYEYNWSAPNYDRAIINFHSASYVENAYPVDYHAISFSVMLDKQTTSQYLTGDFSFYWIDRDPVTSTLLQRLTLSQVYLLTIPAGTYLGEYQWFHVTLDRPIRWRTGGIHQVSNANDNYVRIQTMYVTISEPRGRIATTVTGGSGTVGNLIDGDETTYLSLTQATAATRLISMTPTAEGNRSTIKRLDVYALVDSAGVAMTWGLYAGYLEGGLTKTLQGGIPAGQILSKGWVHFWFECDPDGLFSDWMLSSDGSVLLFMANGAGTCTIRCYEAYWNFDFEGTVTPYSIVQAITADTIRGGLHAAQLVIGDEVTVDLECRADDASGTITGTAGALITRPDHVIQHILVNLLGQSSLDIGSSFAASGSEYSALGYEFAFLAHDISPDVQQLIASLARQCRSMFYEWGGKYELRFWPDTTPTADFAFESNDLIDGEFPVFSFASTRKGDTANKLTCFYRRDYRSQKRTDTEETRKLDPEAASKGFMATPLVASYGAADIEEEITLTAVRDQAHAQDVLDFELTMKQTPAMFVDVPVKWRAIQVDPGQCFSMTDGLMGSNTYRILKYRPIMEQGRIELRGQKV